MAAGVTRRPSLLMQVHDYTFGSRNCSGKTTDSSNRDLIVNCSAGIHAREWITPATITYMIKEIVDNPQKYNCIMDEFDWLFVPVLNPGNGFYHLCNNRSLEHLSFTGNV